MRYMVGAEHTAQVVSDPIGQGAKTNVDVRLVPRGITHAVDVTTGQVACGRSGDGLTFFPDLDWERAAFLVACGPCRDAVLE